MSKIVTFLCVLLFCLLTDCVRSERFPKDFGEIDLFHASEVDGRLLTEEALIEKYNGKYVIPYRKPDAPTTPIYQTLNNLLLSQTESEDPNVNLEIILDELVLGYRNRVPAYTEINKGERLILALRLLKGDNKCSYYSQIVLLNNFYASELDVVSIKNERGLRRIDRILIHYIKQHINDCKEVYFKKFDELLKEFDATQLKHLDGLLRKAMEHLTSISQPNNQGKLYVDRLYAIASEHISVKLNLEPSYVYGALKELVKGDPDEIFLQPVRDNISNLTKIRWDKFNRLYEDYVVQPCYNLRYRLGPELFEPLFFDSMFEHEIRYDRIDFYEFWLKYRLCYFNGSARDSMKEVIEYANNLEHDESNS